MKKKVVIVSVIIMVLSIGLIGVMQFKDYQAGEGLFEYKRFGMKKIEEVIAPTQEGNVIISRQLVH